MDYDPERHMLRCNVCRFLYNENHSLSEWFREAYGGE